MNKKNENELSEENNRVRVYAKIGISEHGKVGTRSGLHRYEVLSGKINDIT